MGHGLSSYVGSHAPTRARMSRAVVMRNSCSVMRRARAVSVRPTHPGDGCLLRISAILASHVAIWARCPTIM